MDSKVLDEREKFYMDEDKEDSQTYKRLRHRRRQLMMLIEGVTPHKPHGLALSNNHMVKPPHSFKEAWETGGQEPCKV